MQSLNRDSYSPAVMEVSWNSRKWSTKLIFTVRMVTAELLFHFREGSSLRVQIKLIGQVLNKLRFTFLLDCTKVEVVDSHKLLTYRFTASRNIPLTKVLTLSVELTVKRAVKLISLRPQIYHPSYVIFVFQVVLLFLLPKVTTKKSLECTGRLTSTSTIPHDFPVVLWLDLFSFSVFSPISRVFTKHNI